MFDLTLFQDRVPTDPRKAHRRRSLSQDQPVEWPELTGMHLHRKAINPSFQKRREITSRSPASSESCTKLKTNPAYKAQVSTGWPFTSQAREGEPLHVVRMPCTASMSCYLLPSSVCITESGLVIALYIPQRRIFATSGSLSSVISTMTSSATRAAGLRSRRRGIRTRL
jgi:hypothetical protein